MLWLYRLQQRLSITRSETWAILTLGSLFALGCGVRYVQQQQVPPLTGPSALACVNASADCRPAPDEADSLSVNPAGGVSLATPADLSNTSREDQPDASAPDEPGAGGNASNGGQVNVNIASAQELQALPGIGPALSQRIIDHRTARGPFASVDALQDVSGIGPKTLATLRPMVAL